MEGDNKVKKKAQIFGIILLLVLTMVGFAGCKKEEAKKEEPKKEVQLKEIGTKSDSGFAVELKNSTGKDIKAVSVKKTEEKEFPASMISGTDVFASGESRILYYTDPQVAVGDKDESSDGNEESAGKEKEDSQTEKVTQGVGEKELTAGYDIQLTLADDTNVVLHGFPFGDMEKGELLFDGQVGYLKYTSVSSKQELDTKEAEVAYLTAEKTAREAAEKAEQEAKAAEEAAAKAQEEAQAAAAQPVYEEPAYSEPAYSEPVYSEPAPTPAPEPTAPAQSDDEACLTDGLTY